MNRRFKTPHNSRGLPAIKTHSSASVRDGLPDFTQTERSNSGVAPVAGRMTAMYPQIAGFNGGSKGSMQQPLVTHTGFDQKRYL